MLLEAIRDSLRLRLLVSLWLGLGLSLIVFLLVVDSIVDREVANSLDDRLLERANTIVAEVGARGADSAARIILPSQPARYDPVYFEIRDATGRLVENSGFPGRLAAASADFEPRYFDLRLPNGHAGRAVALSAPVKRAEHGPAQELFITVAESREKTDELSDELDLILWVGVILILVICSAVTLFTVRRGLRPLDYVAVAASAVSMDRPQTALPLAGVPLEIRPLGEQFNRLLQRLSEALDRERAFSENLAHELRTPLSEIRTLSEVALKGGENHDWRASLTEVGRAAIRMHSVVEALLAVARATRQTAANAAEPVDLARVVRRCLDDRRAELITACPKIGNRLPAELWVTTDAVLLDLVVANLIDNAFKHGSADGVIEFDWLARETGAALRIRNAAPNLTAADLKQLGTRWWQPRAPSEADTPQGTGLGLSIVGSLCEVLNLTPRFEFDEDRHLAVTVAGFQVLRSE